MNNSVKLPGGFTFRLIPVWDQRPTEETEPLYFLQGISPSDGMGQTAYIVHRPSAELPEQFHLAWAALKRLHAAMQEPAA